MLPILIPLAALVIIAVIPTDLERPMQYSLVILVCTSMLWTFGMVPLAVTVILVPVLLC